MSSLKTFSEVYAAAAGAMDNAEETITRLRPVLPVATADDFDHAAMELRFLAAQLNGVAMQKRDVARAQKKAPQWWD